MSNIVIGIEGLVGSGKTSLCRELLQMIPNSIILHGGNLYRGIVYAAQNASLAQKIKIKLKMISKNPIDIKELMDMLDVSIKIENNESVVYVGNTQIDEDKLQSEEASMAVSQTAKKADNSKLYSFAKKLINEYKEQYNLIISGRDLMQIYPELDYHFFITADLEERVNRKMSQYVDNKVNREELKQHIVTRDTLQEETGFYKRYEKTIDVDVTECKTAKESAQKVRKLIKNI